MAIVTGPDATEVREHPASLEFAAIVEQRQITAATRALEARGLRDASPPVSLARRLARRLLRRPDPSLVLKTWDVERAADAFSARLDPADPVLDMGCFACEMLPVLKRLGFSELYGIDLNPAVAQMPYADTIHYTVGDMLATPWPDGHFAGVSAISVIEHGVGDEQLCREVSRLLRPGGIFIFTTDYWPQKVPTAQRIFDLDWRIFDAAEIEALTRTARAHGLHPVSDPTPALRAPRSPAVHFDGKDYTFLYGAFVRGEREAG